jgi:hypothetical protein
MGLFYPILRAFAGVHRFSTGRVPVLTALHRGRVRVRGAAARQGIAKV